MNNSTHHPRLRRKAFTLIELLVVIAVIGVLASLIFPITGVLKKKRMITVAQAELAQVETAIDAYKARYGTYPPDNPNSVVVNPLYFELMGTTNAGSAFVAKDGSSQVQSTDLGTTFGVSGFVNVTRGGNADEAVKADTFLSQLRPNQIGQLGGVGPTPPPPRPCILVCSVGWDNDNTAQQIVPFILAQVTKLTPFQYSSSHPINNPNSYDLWVDLLIKGKTNRISNWSKQAQVL